MVVTLRQQASEGLSLPQMMTVTTCRASEPVIDVWSKRSHTSSRVEVSAAADVAVVVWQTR